MRIRPRRADRFGPRPACRRNEGYENHSNDVAEDAEQIR